MAQCVINVKVLRPGERADELLAEVAKRVHVTPSRQMSPQVAEFWFTDMTAPEAWQVVADSLEAAGDDWDDYLLLGNKPR